MKRPREKLKEELMQKALKERDEITDNPYKLMMQRINILDHTVEHELNLIFKKLNIEKGLFQRVDEEVEISSLEALEEAIANIPRPEWYKNSMIIRAHHIYAYGNEYNKNQLICADKSYIKFCDQLSLRKEKSLEEKLKFDKGPGEVKGLLDYLDYRYFSEVLKESREILFYIDSSEDQVQNSFEEESSFADAPNCHNGKDGADLLGVFPSLEDSSSE